jgi:4'-phosphopantetheinyl transferase
MTEEALQLWYAYPDDLLADRVARACEGLLSEDERVRWQAIKTDRYRREYLATHALARIALSQHRPISPGAWRFQTNAHGKPATAPECGLDFNLSNSLGLVVCLISHGVEVGVDVEPFTRAKEVLAVAPDVFSSEEIAQLQSLQGREKLGRALSLWTLKESYIKARGMGLALPLDKFSFLFDAEGEIRLELDPCLSDQAERWQFCLLEHADHLVALMVHQSTVPALEIWKTHPLMAPPEQLAGGNEKWFRAAAPLF